MIKLKKISAAESPKYKTAEWKDYICGARNGLVSPPVDYEIKGTLINQPKVGEIFWVNRSERNGVKCPGLFNSSVVVSIKEAKGIKVIETRNSVYTLEEIG